jgi:hypothetical protein
MKVDSDDEPFACLESPWSEYYPDPDATVIPMPTRGELRHVRIKPLETVTSRFLNIDESFPGDTFEDLLKTTIKVNGGVKRSRIKDRLSADEILPFAQKLGSGVLEAMHDELFGEDDRPSPVEIKARYWKRMEREALMWKDLEAKSKDQPIDPEQSLAEYVAAGLQLLAKFSTQGVYLALIRECFGIGA